MIDQSQLLQFGRSPDANHDQFALARKNRAQFLYENSIDPQAVADSKPFKECFKKKLYVKIATPNNRDIAYLPATNEHKGMYADQYNAFMQRQKAEDAGTPLAHIAEFSNILSSVYPYGIFTVEALAAIDNQQMIQAEGLSFWQKAAKIYLNSQSPPIAPLVQVAPKRRGRPPKKEKNGKPDNQAGY